MFRRSSLSVAPCFLWECLNIPNVAPPPAEIAGGGMLNTGLRDHAQRKVGKKGTLSDGAERTWTDTALVTTGSTGRGMQLEGAGGSGRGSSGEGNCSSLHMAMYLRIRVVSCTAGVMMEAGASLERCSSGTNQAAIVPCCRSCSAW